MYTSIVTIYEFVVILMYLTRNCTVYANKYMFCSVCIYPIHINYMALDKVTLRMDEWLQRIAA